MFDIMSMQYMFEVTCQCLQMYPCVFLTKTHEDVSSCHVEDVHVGGGLHVGLRHDHHQHQNIARDSHLTENHLFEGSAVFVCPPSAVRAANIKY